MTFEDIQGMEPGIKELYRMAKMIGRKRKSNFCANMLWYKLFKPRLVKLVGWNRKINKHGRFVVYSIEDFMSGIPDDDLIHDPGPLGTPEAYSIAYHAIYNALPDCGPSCGCF